MHVVIARATKQPSRIARAAVDGFASLAMTLFVAMAFAVAGLASPAFAQSPAEQISQFRAKNGEGKVVMDATLNSIAQEQATAMAAKDVLEHDVAGSFNSRVARSKAASAAENIAYGYADFPRTLGQWINSAGHRRNLLLKGATKLGVANAKSASGRTYWAMVIAGEDEKPKAKPKPATKPATKGAPDAAKDKPAKDKVAAKPKPAAKKDCTIKLLGLCI